MEVFVQQVINGITLGSIYGLIAIGYTMVFGIIGMVNFAHGDVFMVSSFIALIAFLIVTAWLGISSVFLALLIVLIVGMVLTSLVNWTIERLAYRPLRGSFRLAPLISAIGMSIFLVNFVQVTQGPRNKSIPPLVQGDFVLIDSATYPVTLSYKQLIIWLITAALLIAFWYLVTRTSLGRAQRACEQDQKMAALVGIDVNRTISITFVIGAALAAVAGAMYLMHYGVVNFADGFVPGVKAFTAAVLGGIGSLPGAVLGGLLIGLIETLWSAYFSIDYKDVAAFSILAITLIFLPQGILGRPPGLRPVPAADRVPDRHQHAQRARARHALAAARLVRGDRGGRPHALQPRAGAVACPARGAPGGRAHGLRQRLRPLVHTVRARLRHSLSGPRHPVRRARRRREMDRQFRHPDSHLRDARLGPQHRGWPRRPARPRLRGVLRGRRLFVRSAGENLRVLVLAAVAARRHAGGVLGHPARLPGAAPAR